MTVNLVEAQRMIDTIISVSTLYRLERQFMTELELLKKLLYTFISTVFKLMA